MKTTNKLLILVLIINSMLNLNAQSNKSTLAVISIDTKNIEIDPMAMGNMTRVELEKLDTFNIIDKYDVQQLLDKSSVSMTNCFGKNCLVELGLKLKCDKMFSGSAEVIGKNIIITFRLLNVKSNEIEKTHVEEFLNIPEELQNMVKLSLCKMFNKPLNVNLYNKLSKKYSFDNTTNNPASDILVLDGPRMGFTSFTGKDLEIIKGKKNQGGFDLFPMLFQFGYQFEKQYLNEGNVQALFEFIPLITGLDQSYFIPSVTLLHGIRSNINGWEFAFGPSFNLSKMAKGYYDSNNHWQLENHWKESPETRGTENPNEIIKRMDSRGNYSFQSYFVFAVGKTFKSGKLNIPLNAFVIPGKDGWRYGLSFGFNAKNRK